MTSPNEYVALKLHGRKLHLACCTRSELNHIDGYMLMRGVIRPSEKCDACKSPLHGAACLDEDR